MKLLKALSLVCALALLAPAANAAMVLQISDGATTVITVDNAAGDMDGSAGSILFSGSVGAFTVNFSSGISKSVPGVADLTVSSSVNSSTGGTLSILLTDTNFASPFGNSIAVSLAGTLTNGTVAFQSYIDNANAEFGQGQQLADFGPFVASGGLQNLSSPEQVVQVVTSPPFSLTWAAQINQQAGGFSPSLTANVRVSGNPVASSPLPEPSAALCFGLGGLLVGGAIRRRSL